MFRSSTVDSELTEEDAEEEEDAVCDDEEDDEADAACERHRTDPLHRRSAPCSKAT